MIFRSSNTAITIPNEATASTNQNSSPSVSVLLDAGSRLAAALALYIDSRTIHPLTRYATASVARTQVRFCIATLSNAGSGGLAVLRAQMSQAVRSIRNAPNEATARALYKSPRVQEVLWAWSSAEAAIYVKSMTKTTPVDADKQADLVGDAVMGFVREEANRVGVSKLNPFSMARTWDSEIMEDPLPSLRNYLHAWCKKMVQEYWQERIHEGVSLDAPAGGFGDEGRASIGELVEDKGGANPETAMLDRNDHRSQVAAMTAIYERQLAGLERDIESFGGRNDSYSVGQRHVLESRLDAIKAVVGPLLSKLKATSAMISATETNNTIDEGDRTHQVRRLREQFDLEMRNLTVISESQQKAHGARINREENGLSRTPRPKDVATEPIDRPTTQPRGKKLPSDPITTERAYARARENAELLLPYVYRALTHRQRSDLSKKYTSGLITNWSLVDGINNSQHDLHSALSSDHTVRSRSSDNALFSTTSLKMMMLLRDIYTYDERYSVMREDGESVPRGAKQRFAALMTQEIERDPVLRSRAPQLIDLLNQFIASSSFLTLWNSTDHLARSAAYEWSRRTELNKRWSDLSTDESNIVADAAGNLLYNNQHRPFAARSLGDL